MQSRAHLGQAMSRKSWVAWGSAVRDAGLQGMERILLCAVTENVLST